MNLLQEFKEFAMRGNVVDMAIGIVVGGAFGKLVSGFVANIVMPPLGLLVGGMDFKDLAITLKKATAGQEAVVMKYGLFLQSVLDFILMAFAIFMMIKAMNALKRKEESEPAAQKEPPKQEVLLEEIRDLLRK
jgi:large conductance mechanosensitive channel